MFCAEKKGRRKKGKIEITIYFASIPKAVA